MTGLGQAWLARSQNVLARIHRTEGSSSSGSSGRPQSLSDRLAYSSSEEARDAERATAEADARAHTADYVEARGMLIPAVDHFARAIEVAERNGEPSGELLSEAAEANMSLGNVSYSHQNEQYFQRAIRYLRRAAQIPGFRLSSYLQRCGHHSPPLDPLS
jgi:tetratricopeptide (TPR) repeat protein